MTAITSYSPLDMASLNFYQVTQGSYASYLYTNYTYDGVLYPSLVEVDWQENGNDFASIFAGSGILLDAGNNIIAGTVSEYVQAEWNGLAWVPLWGITDFSTSASALYQAFLTPSTADDFAIISSVLSGNDIISTGSGNDRVAGFAGDDTIDGHGGVDTAVFSGSSDNFQWLNNPDGSLTITDLRPGAPDGTDLLRSVEVLEFHSAAGGGGTTITSYDLGNAFSWSTDTRVYDAQGTLSTIRDKSDAGPTFFTDYNLDHADPWKAAVTTYDAQDRLGFVSIYKDVTLVTTYDAAGDKPWSQAITGYDSQGRLSYVTVVNDDHSSLYTRYSYSGDVDYAIYSYDAQNHLAQSYIHHPNGTSDIVIA